MVSRKLVWTEGLFVTQHHFQQLDRYHDARLFEVASALTPYNFGVLECEIDERALTQGQFRVEHLSAILPDGTFITCGEGQEDAVQPRALGTVFAMNLHALDVYIALPQVRDGAPVVDLDGTGTGVSRYTRAQVPVNDENTGDNEQSVSWARHNLRIVFGNEPTESYEVIRLAQLVRSSTGAVVLRDTYVPPVMRVGASPFLVDGFRRVLSAMTGKQRGLSDSRRQRSSTTVDFQAGDTAKFWLLNTLNRYIPPVSHLVDQKTLHPEAAYLLLVELVGQLCTFAVDGDPTNLPRFNYLELGEVFEPLFARALALLNSVISERFIEVPLTLGEDGIHRGKVDDPKVLKYDFYLAVAGDAPEAQLRDRVPKLSKIASWEHIESILNSAMNGARLELEYRAPSALPLKPGLLYFKVSRTAEFWPDIARTGTVAIYQPQTSGQLKLSLYAVDPSNL